MEMSSSALPRGGGIPRAVRTSLALLVLVVGAYFVTQYAFHYLIVTEESYGRYWPQAGWLLAHVVFGIVAISIGPLQLWSRIRNRYRKFHRVAGRAYVVTIVGGSTAAIAMTVMRDTGLAFRTGLFFLAVAWLTTTGMAFAAIRRKKTTLHREWMIRSYVVTFGFVTFRLGQDTAVDLGLASAGDMAAVMAWACWAVPLLVTEVVLQGRKVFGTA